MKLNQIAARAGSTKARMRVGRGIGSGKGKTGGRGGKGQTARSGVRIKGFEGGQMPLHRRLPKRGFTSASHREFLLANLDDLAAMAAAGVSNAGPEEILKHKSRRKAPADGIKILGNGELKAAITVRAHAFSATAKTAIEAAGGKIENIAVQPKPVVRKDGKGEAKKARRLAKAQSGAPTANPPAEGDAAPKKGAAKKKKEQA
jgi:large subunit ribosomal protein L15